MDPFRDDLLAYLLNYHGVLVYNATRGVQYSFRLRIADLSPSAEIYTRAKAHIEDTDFTLVPTAVARRMKSMARQVFGPHPRSAQNAHGDLITIPTVNYLQNHYIPRSCLQTFEENRSCVQEMLREVADQAVQPDYERYLVQAFRRVYEFFLDAEQEGKANRKRFGDPNAILKEIEAIYEELGEFKASRRERGQETGAADLAEPGLRTAFKLQDIPRTYSQYRGAIMLESAFFHYSSETFKGLLWDGDLCGIRDFDSAMHLLKTLRSH